MQHLFQTYNLLPYQWFLFALCALMIGLAKAGISGAGLLVVPLMANIFGGRESVGIVLPMLIFADVYAVIYYNRHAEWKYVYKLLPWAITGILAGFFFGKSINDVQFKQTIAVLVLVGILLMIWQDVKGKRMNIPDNWWVAAILGLTGGFTTMVGNAAGPIMILYLLAMRLPKNSFIGTGAWFFFIVNLLKVPLHIFFWKTIVVKSFLLDLMALPVILLGAYLGIRVVRIIPEKAYRIFIITTTILSAAFLLFRK